MRWVSRQRVLNLAASAVVVAIGIVSAGCDAKESDRKAMEQFDRGDYAAAAKGAESPSIRALAASRAADVSLATALPAYRDLSFSHSQVADSLYSLNRLAAQADVVFSSAQALAKFDPQAALSSIDTTVQQVKGEGGAQAWAPAGSDVQMPTVASTIVRANQLKDQIAEIERNLTDVKRKRDAAAADSQRLMDESKASMGEKSVQLYKQFADARQQANTLGVEVERIEASLVPLKQELAVVEGQNQLAGQTTEILASQRENIEKSWRGIQAQAEQRATLVAGIFGKPGDAGGTINSQAARLAELSAEQEKLAASYQEQLQGASSLAKDAVTNSEKAVKAAGLSRGASKVVTPGELLKVALDPSAARFTQASIDLSLGSSQGMQADLLSSRARIVSNVAQVARKLNQKLPEGLDVDAAKTAQDVAAAASAETLRSATDQFGVVSEAPTASADTKRAGTIGQMLALDAGAMLAQTQGDAAGAKQSLDQAMALRDKLVEGGEKLPSLPRSLQPGQVGVVAPGATPAPAPKVIEEPF